jgi:hypothetical protein
MVTVRQERRRRKTMTLTIGDAAPDFEAGTTEGPIRFHEWIGDSWAVLFSHPKDFTPVCTTELGYMARMKHDFDRRGVKIIGLSADSTGDHERWAADIAETQGAAPPADALSGWPQTRGCCPLSPDRQKYVPRGGRHGAGLMPSAL